MASLKAQKPLTAQPASAGAGQAKKEPAKPTGNPPSASSTGPKKTVQKPREPKKAPVSKPGPAKN